MAEFLAANKDSKPDANQYFHLFKQGVELQNKSVTEKILVTIKAIHSH